ncbi:MAG TPA: LysM peptidoglycan-binding domain-containing protein [Chitinophagaceae bacterium]|nr:LysM peptidoglycan-binding domain-containing protein [Chitinophagaceae bacterium]
MALRTKYQQLIDTATRSGVQGLQVREQNNVLYIDGTAPSEAVKKQLWDLYNKIDPDYRAGDLVLDLKLAAGAAAPAQPQTQTYEVQKGDSLSKIATKYGLKWQDIFAVNKDQIKDPDLIQPGWKLKIPAK